jgi:hypothetical protein
MKVKECFLNLGQLQLNHGSNIRFWKDRWMGDYTLHQQYPSLYAITRKKNILVAHVFSHILLNITFH